MTKDINELPLLPLRGLLVFPSMVLHLDVGRKKSIAALEKAMMEDQHIFLAAQKKVSVEEPKMDEIYRVGKVAEIKKMLKLHNGTIRVLVERLERELIHKITEEIYVI